YRFLEVFPIDLVHLRGDAKAKPRAPRQLDGPLQALFGRDTSEKSQIFSRTVNRAVEILRQTVVNGGLPVEVRKRAALGARNRADGHFRVLAIERHQIGEIEPPVERAELASPIPAAERKMKVVDVKVNDVEIQTTRKNLLE